MNIKGENDILQPGGWPALAIFAVDFRALTR
jgi:hypothetical protein